MPMAGLRFVGRGDAPGGFSDVGVERHGYRI